MDIFEQGWYKIYRIDAYSWHCVHMKILKLDVTFLCMPFKEVQYFIIILIVILEGNRCSKKIKWLFRFPMSGQNLFLVWSVTCNVTLNCKLARIYSNRALFRPKKKLLCCPLPTDRKMRKNRVGISFFFMSDLGEEFAKICIQWLKKALVYMRFDCIPPEFSPFRNFLKNIGKLNSLTVRKKKKKKKKKSTDRPNFQILVGWGQHNNFFFLPYDLSHGLPIVCLQ